MLLWTACDNGRCMLCVILLSPDNELQTHSRTQKSAVQTHLQVPRMKLHVDQVWTLMKVTTVIC